MPRLARFRFFFLNQGDDGKILKQNKVNVLVSRWHAIHCAVSSNCQVYFYVCDFAELRFFALPIFDVQLRVHSRPFCGYNRNSDYIPDAVFASFVIFDEHSRNATTSFAYILCQGFNCILCAPGNAFCWEMCSFRGSWTRAFGGLTSQTFQSTCSRHRKGSLSIPGRTRKATARRHDNPRPIPVPR